MEYLNPEWLLAGRRTGIVQIVSTDPHPNSWTYMGTEDRSKAQDGDYWWISQSVYKREGWNWKFAGRTHPDSPHYKYL